MADAVVNALVQNLPRLLLQEMNLDDQVKAEIKSLQGQLGFLQAFLKATDADGKRNKNEIIKETVSQIRDTLYEAEDSIDTYVYYAQRKRLEKMLHFIEHKKMLHNIAYNIENITRRIENIKKNQQDYGLQFDRVEAPEADLPSIHEVRRNVEEEDVAGFEKHSAEVIKKLTEGRPQRVVISIVGMGGLGKTTLAKRIYEDAEVKRHFDHRAWTYVSKDVDAKAILLSLLEHRVSEKNIEDLKLELRKSLENKRYLVFLDDIWDTTAWDEMQGAFPDGEYGSRVLITSRSNEVANYASVSPVNQYPLPFLGKKESWDLFSKKVFKGEDCPPDLEDLGKTLAESCDGLPLSIVVLAGILAKLGKSKDRWSLVAGNEIWHLYGNPDKTVCSKILALSYYYLPRRLKPCFLYVGMYPEDYEISARQLIRLWIAEGLIQEETGNKQPEDVAELNLIELIDRNLIQVASRRLDGGVKECRVHDLLRELCIDESKKEKFYQVQAGNVGNSTLARPRRLSLYCRESSYQSSSLSSDHSSVRSLIFFLSQTQEDDHGDFKKRSSEMKRCWDSILRVLKLVRVLDMGLSRLRFTVPSRIAKLIQLRYLRIDYCDSEDLMDNICFLRNLETLEVGEVSNAVLTLPKKIKNLKRLRHLLMFRSQSIPRLDEPMENLQSFCNAALDDYLGVHFSNAMFPKLRKLALRQGNIRGNADEFWSTLLHLSDLETLKLVDGCPLPRNPYVFPSKLKKITLMHFWSIGSQEIQLLGAIPTLEVLKILQSGHPEPEGVVMDCRPGEFRNLKAFVMYLRCTEWNLVTGAMPRLQKLVILSSLLMKLPHELWSLADLEDVQVIGPTEPLLLMLRELKMKDGCKLTIIN